MSNSADEDIMRRARQIFEREKGAGANWDAEGAKGPILGEDERRGYVERARVELQIEAEREADRLPND